MRDVTVDLTSRLRLHAKGTMYLGADDQEAPQPPHVINLQSPQQSTSEAYMCDAAMLLSMATRQLHDILPK
jgi:hypothetical protein